MEDVLNKMNGDTVDLLVMDQTIPFTRISDDLLVPASMMDDEICDKAIDIAKAILDVLPPEAKLTPWIIGSMSTDILGNVRDAKSHAEHHAFDMSPMYSEDCPLDPQRKMMGLAWNIVNLSMIAPASNLPYWFCVEGDHLHVDITPLQNAMWQEVGLNQGDLLTIPTACDWYPIVQDALASGIASALVNQPFVFKWKTMSLLGPAEIYDERSVREIFSNKLPNY